MSKIFSNVLNILIFIIIVNLSTGCALESGLNKRRNHNVNPVIAHRGAWKYNKLPQNSISSLKEAIRLKCAGSEFDVHLTADDVLVVNHDYTFYGLDIEKSTYEQLLLKKHPNGESIPTAEEYLKAGLNQKVTKLIYELKASEISKARTLKAAAMAVELVKRFDKHQMVEFISFDYDALKLIHSLNPQVKTAYLNGNTEPSQVKADELSGIDYHISFYKKFENWIRDAHQMGLSVNVWTVNKEEDMVYFVDRGADYITTDFPELLFEVWEKQEEIRKQR